MVKKAKNFITKNPWKIAFILVIVVAAIRWWSPWKSDNSTVQDFFDVDTVVWTGNLETVLTLQGTTQFADSQKLTFMNKGKVKSVNVKVGDMVKKGQILATITTDDLDNTIEQARIDIQNQQTTLDDLLDGYNLELEYLQQKANYDALILKLKTIDQDHVLAMEELLQKIEDAQKTYDDAKDDYDELLSGSNSATADLALSSLMRKRNTTFQNAVLDLKTIISSVQTNLDSFDQKMILTNKYVHSSKNMYIWAQNESSREEAEKYFWIISNQLSTLESLYKVLEIIPVQDLTNEQILEAYSLVKDMWSNLVTWGEISYEMFKASIDASSYTIAQIDADATAALKNQTLGVGYIQKYSTIVDALADLKDDTSLEDSKLKMDKAKTSLDKLQLQVDVLLTDQEKEKASLEDQIDTVQRNIKKIQRGESLNETQIISARNRLRQLQNSLATSLKKYEDYRLEANFDGVVTQMDIQVGDSIDNSSNGTIKYIYIENNNVLEMALSVEQVDIIKLKVWMDVVVYLDAYSTTSYRGIITEINTVPSSAGNVTTYDVTVTFEKNTPEEVVLAGMWGNAKIILDKSENVLVVPNQAISRKDGKMVVKLYKNAQWIDQEVIVGKSDEVNTEIISWLSLWDTIKAMYITLEGMTSAGISTQQETFDMTQMWGGWWGRGGQWWGNRGGWGSVTMVSM